MNVVCPHRHLLYSKWRLQLYRGLFPPQHLEDSIQRRAGQITTPNSQRPCAVRKFTASPHHGKRRKASKKSRIDDADALAFLEDAARRTTTPQVVDPNLTLRSTPPSSQRAKSAAPQTYMSAHMPKNRKRQNESSNNSRKGSKTKPKTRKKIEEEEAAAFLEEATKRVTGGRGVKQFLSPAQAQTTSNTVSNRPKIQKQINHEDELEEATVLKGTRTHVNFRRMSEPLKPVPQKNAISFSDFMEQMKEEDTFPPKKASKRAKYQGLAELHTAQTRLPQDMADPKQKTMDAFTSRSGLAAIPGARLSAVTKRVAGKGQEEADKARITDKDFGIDLGKWFRESVDLAKQSKVRPASRKEANLARRKAAPGKGPHPNNPWTFRTPAQSIWTKATQAKPIGSEQDVSEPKGSHFGMEQEIQEPQIELNNTKSKAISAKMLSGPEISDRNSSSPNLVSHKRPSGILSSLEHEELSSLLLSLRSGDFGEKDVEQESGFKPLSETLPRSPVQSMQARERQTKERAMAEAKKRLQDNPWAEWLASPIRMCQATGVRVPSKLMVGWNCVRNPKNEQVYLMPAELTNMSQLSKGTKPSHPPSKASSIANVQRTASHSPPPKPNVEITIMTAASGSPPPADDTRSDKNAQRRSSLSPAVLGMAAGSPQGEVSIPPAKLHMRPSSMVLEELSNRMLATDGSMRTSPGTVNRLLPTRWKDQARRFEKSDVAKAPRASFLTAREMLKIKWHPKINDVMLNLLRSRVLKTLESAAVRNSLKTGVYRRIIPLPPAESDTPDEDGVTTTASEIQQAIFLWLGAEEPSCDNTRSPHSPPTSPSTCHHSTLGFVPRPHTASTTISPASSRDASKDIFAPIWTHHPSATPSQQITQTAQDQHLPPRISTHLPHDNPNPYSLPAFDLPTLLGASSLSTLHALAHDNPAIAEAFGLDGTATTDQECNAATASSGWVLVKGGNGTYGFKALCQEVWRLWLFVGGRDRGGED